VSKSLEVIVRKRARTKGVVAVQAYLLTLEIPAFPAIVVNRRILNFKALG
jgi:hypothetical protein